MLQQILFNFESDVTPDAITPHKNHLVRVAMRRAVIKWLLDQSPDDRPAIGTDVATRGSILRADIGAAWFKPTRMLLADGHYVTVWKPVRTLAVICATQRQECWPECDNAEKVLSEIASIRRELAAIEADIRLREPQLRETNVLFDEYADWNYAGTSNTNYLKLQKRCAALELTLYRGSRLSRISAAQGTNQVILAVPEGTLSPQEVVSFCGILEVNTDTMGASLLKEPDMMPSPQELQQCFATNIAAANTRNTIDCNGIRIRDDGSTAFLKMPTFRRKTISEQNR